MGARGNIAALQPWRPEPAEPGVPMPAGLRERLGQWKDERQRAEACSLDAAWARIPEGTRDRLIAMCTDRPMVETFRPRWRDLTESERAEIAAAVRGLVRDLGPVAGVLRP